MPAVIVCIFCGETLTPETSPNHPCFVMTAEPCTACGAATHSGNPSLPAGCWTCSSRTHYNAGMIEGYKAGRADALAETKECP